MSCNSYDYDCADGSVSGHVLKAIKFKNFLSEYVLWTLYILFPLNSDMVRLKYFYSVLEAIMEMDSVSEWE